MVGITVLIVNVPSTNRNFRTSPKIAPYRHEQPTYKQDGSLQVSETERKSSSNVLYETTEVPTTELTTDERTTQTTSYDCHGIKTEEPVCCIPKCGIIARKSGMCDCLDWGTQWEENL